MVSSVWKILLEDFLKHTFYIKILLKYLDGYISMYLVFKILLTTMNCIFWAYISLLDLGFPSNVIKIIILLIRTIAFFTKIPAQNKNTWDNVWVIKKLTISQYHIRHSSKSIWVIKLSFSQGGPSEGGSFWQKDSLITHILFKLCQIWYYDMVSFFMTQTLFYKFNCLLTYYWFFIIFVIKYLRFWHNLDTLHASLKTIKNIWASGKYKGNESHKNSDTNVYIEIRIVKNHLWIITIGFIEIDQNTNQD